MPGSMPEGKQFIKDFLLTKDIKRILDVGPGSGNYHDLLTKVGEYSDYNGGSISGVEWVAMEIWEAYVERFELLRKYDKVHIGDIYWADWNSLGTFDVIILGDVIEHMEENRGRKVIRQAVAHSRFVILSLPIVDFPQEGSYGNAYEAHVAQYYHDTVMEILGDYRLISYNVGNTIGTYIIGGEIDD